MPEVRNIQHREQEPTISGLRALLRHVPVFVTVFALDTGHVLGLGTISKCMSSLLAVETLHDLRLSALRCLMALLTAVMTGSVALRTVIAEVASLEIVSASSIIASETPYTYAHHTCDTPGQGDTCGALNLERHSQQDLTSGNCSYLVVRGESYTQPPYGHSDCALRQH